MKSLPLMLYAAGLLAFGGAAHAANRDVDAYLQRAASQASTQVAAAGVELPAQGLRLQGRVAGDGRITGLHVARSSGSLEIDQKAIQALRRFRSADPPPLLIGAEVGVTLAPPSTVQAGAP